MQIKNTSFYEFLSEKKGQKGVFIVGKFQFSVRNITITAVFKAKLQKGSTKHSNNHMVNVKIEKREKVRQNHLNINSDDHSPNTE